MTSDYITREFFNWLVDALPAKYRAICETAAATGFRIGDLCDAPRGAWDCKTNTLTLVEEKTGKTRSVIIDEGSAAYFTLLMHVMRWDNDGADRQYLFQQPNGRKFNRTAVWKQVRQAAAWNKISTDASVISPHSFRKLYAVEQREKGKTLVEVQRDLNHASPDVTIRYYYADMLMIAHASAQKASQ